MSLNELTNKTLNRKETKIKLLRTWTYRLLHECPCQLISFRPLKIRSACPGKPGVASLNEFHSMNELNYIHKTFSVLKMNSSSSDCSAITFLRCLCSSFFSRMTCKEISKFSTRNVCWAKFSWPYQWSRVRSWDTVSARSRAMSVGRAAPVAARASPVAAGRCHSFCAQF